MMMICEYVIRLDDLIKRISGLRERWRSAGRLLYVSSLVADAAELAEGLNTDVLERVSHDIVLEAYEGNYVAQAEQIQALVPVKVLQADAEDEAACRQLDEGLNRLVGVLTQIAPHLERRHSKDEYARLYEAEKRRYLNSGTAGRARQKFDDWKEDTCFGQPTTDDIDNYFLEKLVHLFEQGALDSKAEHIKKPRSFPGEVDFEQLDESKEKKAMFRKHYAALRSLTDWQDGYLVVDPLRVGQFFFSSREETNAKSHRNVLLKYLHKIDMVQQVRKKLLEAEAGGGDGTLNYYAPEKNLKVLLSEEWFEIHRTDKRYDHRWTNDFVNALMASEHREYIATEWGKYKRQDYIRGCVLGLLKEGGVIKGSMDCIARSAGVCENFRTFSKYMGQCRQEPFAQWILEYIIKVPQK
jgi:hypothetical protein